MNFKRFLQYHDGFGKCPLCNRDITKEDIESVNYVYTRLKYNRHIFSHLKCFNKLVRKRRNKNVKINN